VVFGRIVSSRPVYHDTYSLRPALCAGHRRRENGVAALPPGIVRGALFLSRPVGEKNAARAGYTDKVELRIERT
jgi:hypothetical protein